MFYVIGVGPGDPSYLTKKGHDIISSSKVLVGARRHLDSFSTLGQKTVELKASNLREVIDYLRTNKKKDKISVLVSGDPGFFSFGRLIAENFEFDEFEFVPGISSVQLAFSRLKKPWDDTAFISMHGKEISADILKEVNAKKELFRSCCFLGDKSINPCKLLDVLVKDGEYSAVLLSELSLAGEVVIDMNNKHKLELNGLGNWVLVLEKK